MNSIDRDMVRRAAEKKYAARKNKGPRQQTEADQQKSLQELQIHQIELEMQQEELLRMKEVLEANQQLFTEMEQVGKVGGWELNIDTGQLNWTEEACRIHELDPSSEINVEKWAGLYAPASRPVIKAALEQAKGQGIPFEQNLEIISAKGDLRNVHVIGNPNLASRRVYGFFQDVTLRKQAEGQLRNKVNELEKFYQLTIGRELKMIDLEKTMAAKDRQLENTQEAASLVDLKYETLVRNLPCMVYLGKADWSVEVLANSEKVCGYRGEEFKDNKVNWADIIYGEDKERVLSEAAALPKMTGPLTQRYRITAKDGSVLAIEDHKSPIFAPDGSYAGVCGVVFRAG